MDGSSRVLVVWEVPSGGRLVPEITKEQCSLHALFEGPPPRSPSRVPPSAGCPDQTLLRGLFLKGGSIGEVLGKGIFRQRLCRLAGKTSCLPEPDHMPTK